MRAGLHVGALRALERLQGSLSFPDGIWGCSAGAILATAVAFNLSAAQIQTMYFNHVALSDILPSPRLEAFAALITKKGLFSMDRFEEAMIHAFQSQGIDLSNKTIADAPQPLYIVASNLTTHNPTVFTKHVRILDALRCSSCIPFVFQPQVLYNNVYVDGGVLVDCLSSITPSTTLVLHLSEPGSKVFVQDIESMTLTTYLHRIYRATRTHPHGSNILWLQNATIGILHDMTPEEKEMLLRDGDSQTLAFFAKRFPNELKNAGRSALSTEVREEGTRL